MLYLYKSNRMEVLSRALSTLLKTGSISPMQPEWICVQSRGMKQWLTLEIATASGISANLKFAFPREIIRQILSSSRDSTASPIDSDDVFWMILKQLYSKVSPDVYPPLEHYLRDDPADRKKFHLAAAIARLFDDYQVYRPDMVMQWQEMKRAGKIPEEAAEAWQAGLWNQMAALGDCTHFAHLSDAFLNDAAVKTPTPDGLPERISLFGISSLPPLFLSVFNRISQVVDIHLFLLVPTPHFFMDEPYFPVEPGRLPHAQGAAGAGNPLLSGMGGSGRQFLSLLEQFDYREVADSLFVDPAREDGSMLSVIQSDIFQMKYRGAGGDVPPEHIRAGDDSISIHACHSPMREAQVLKDLLLDAFETDPDLKPHEVIVMMPDIESYAPFIESVFLNESRLDIAVTDRKKRSESVIFDAILKLFAMRNGRLERSGVMELLLSRPIAKKFSIEAAEIDRIEQVLDAAGVFWGMDGRHREKLGLKPYPENTWQFGLDRLFLGMAMPETCVEPLMGVLPCDLLEGLELELLGKLAHFLNTLFEGIHLLEGSKGYSQWCRDIRNLVEKMIFNPAAPDKDLKFFMEILSDLDNKAGNAGFDAIVPFDVISGYLEMRIDSNLAQGNFFSGKITFCNLLPMRSVPYRIVALMGMDEAAFPRKTTAAGFDLIRKHPRKGDKHQRNDDQYLFLETLLSAREKFIVTYTGFSDRDNSELPVSGSIQELQDVMDESFYFPEHFSFFHAHLLHGFQADYFDGTSDLFSYSRKNCTIASRLCRPETGEHSFLSADQGSGATQAAEPVTIEIDELIRFFSGPVAYFMRNRLGIVYPEIDTISKDRENFEIKGLSQYQIGNELVQALVEQKTGMLDPEHFRARGVLPLGSKGTVEFDRLKALSGPVAGMISRFQSSGPLPDLNIELPLAESLILSGRLSPLYQDGLLVEDFGVLNGKRLIRSWIRHLFLNAARTDGMPLATVMICRDPYRGIAARRFQPVQDAGEILRNLSYIFNTGGTSPVIFFPEISHALAAHFHKTDADPGEPLPDSLLNKLGSLWYGSDRTPGESRDPYAAFCLAGQDPFENETSLRNSGFVELSLEVFGPLLASMEDFS